MDRRAFLMGATAFGTATAAGGWTGLTGGLGLPKAAHAEAGGSESGMLALLRTLEEVRAQYLSPAEGSDPNRVAEGERALAHILHTGLYFFLEADPERPVFKPYVTPTRKLLGDNPDSVYYFAPIRDDRSYRIQGNIAGATFTSFTIEGGSAQGHAARSSVAAIHDDDMEIAKDGSYEITVSRSKPARGNWLQSKAGAGQITTRHYHEARQSIAAIDGLQIPLHIEPSDPKPLEPYGGASQVEARLSHVANYVREHAAMSLSPPRDRGIPWFSFKPNHFNPPGQWLGSDDEGGYGNTHAWYGSAFYELAPDEALVITGRFPQCRFANVVLWNHFMQSYDFANRRISYNRQQVSYEKDGSFRLVLAHADPGVPNWLDTEGRPSGQIYWRYVLPIEAPETPVGRVVKHASLG